MKPICICGAAVTVCAIFLAGVFLSGCTGIVRDFPETRLFVIDSPRIRDTAPGFETGRGLLIRQLDISAEFESSFFVYKVSDNRFSNDYYNKFMVSPARMISDAVRDALDTSVEFRLVSANEPSRIDFRLSGKITHLYVDIREPAQLSAVMALRLVLEKRVETGFMPVINQVYRISEPVPGKRSDAYIQAWNRCLEQVVTDFLTDVKSVQQPALDRLQSGVSAAPSCQPAVQRPGQAGRGNPSGPIFQVPSSLTAVTVVSNSCSSIRPKTYPTIR